MITVRYFAGARAAAGVSEESLPATGTLHELVAVLAQRHGPRLRTVLGASSFLVDGVRWGEPHRELPRGAVIDVLPPFAGG